MIGVKMTVGAIAVSLTALILRQVKPEYGLFLELSALIWGALALISLCSNLLDYISGLLSFTQVNSEFIKLLFQALGVTVCTQLGADLCRDSGNNALANGVEFGGKVLVLSLSLPLFKSMAALAAGLMEF